jgi:hypothetical protein
MLTVKRPNAQLAGQRSIAWSTSSRLSAAAGLIRNFRRALQPSNTHHELKLMEKANNFQKPSLFHEQAFHVRDSNPLSF